MINLEIIIERLKTSKNWDPHLWEILERVECVPQDKFNDRNVEPRPLKHISNESLQSRLEGINSNIQYLDHSDGRRDDCPPDKG